MKLVYCAACNDVFRMQPHRKRVCSCGKSHGKYVNEHDVRVSGPCVVLGASDIAVEEAVAKHLNDGGPHELAFFLISAKARTVTREDM